jgi:hypothetical protein
MLSATKVDEFDLHQALDEVRDNPPEVRMPIMRFVEDVVFSGEATPETVPYDSDSESCPSDWE